MPNRYTALLDTAYTTYIDSGVVYPAGGRDPQPVLQQAQREKIETLFKGNAPSVMTTLRSCGESMARAQSDGYDSKRAFESVARNNARLLSTQVQALANLLSAFERPYQAWVRKGATLDWDSRRAAVKGQQELDAQLQSSVAEIQSEVDRDIATVLKQWPGEPEPPEPSGVDVTAQREALMDAALNGVPLVAIDPSLRGVV
jgi:hypothetical protein